MYGTRHGQGGGLAAIVAKSHPKRRHGTHASDRRIRPTETLRPEITRLVALPVSFIGMPSARNFDERPGFDLMKESRVANRSMNLVLCVLLALPQPICACTFGCEGELPIPGERESHRDHSGRESATIEIGRHPHQDCPCRCHDSSHVVVFRVAESSEPDPADSDLLADFLDPVTPAPRNRSATLTRPLVRPPSAFHVPLYISFCSLRN